jgi:hypothetical protein
MIIQNDQTEQLSIRGYLCICADKIGIHFDTV